MGYRNAATHAGRHCEKAAARLTLRQDKLSVLHKALRLSELKMIGSVRMALAAACLLKDASPPAILFFNFIFEPEQRPIFSSLAIKINKV